MEKLDIKNTSFKEGIDFEEMKLENPDHYVKAKEDLYVTEERRIGYDGCWLLRHSRECNAL